VLADKIRGEEYGKDLQGMGPDDSEHPVFLCSSKLEGGISCSK